jgi:hypothetical protein
MPENQNATYNSLELTPISHDELLVIIKEVISRKIPVFRLNSENAFVTLPLDKIERYLGESSSADIVFYIEKDWNLKPASNSAAPQSQSNPQRQKIFNAVEKYGHTADQIENFSKKSIVQREEVLDSAIETLHELKNGKGIFDISVIIETVKIIANTFYTNYANLNDTIESDSIVNTPHGIYVKTEWIVQLIIELFRENPVDIERYRIIDEISTGSYTIDNMNKSLLWFIGFCLFYNDYIDKGLVARNIRGNFKEHHLRFYKKRFPGENLSIERIVKDGLRRIDFETELLPYSTGALLYDIGKLPLISYHDGTDEYDENAVRMHVLVGYNMIRNARKYPFIVSAMAAFHHEYYGGKGSYQFTNPILFKLTGKKRSDDAARYFITYNQTEFSEGLALSFFPCKMLEIVDVFNALVHKKANSPNDALKIMKKHFIAHSLKIDPIIFDIFVEFKIKCGVVSSTIKDELNTILY